MVRVWTLQDIPPQNGRFVVVTGATSGVGYQTALQLAKSGAEILLPARNAQRGREAIQKIQSIVPGSRIHLHELDLGDFDSVRAFGKVFHQQFGSQGLDLLINNAGIMALPKRTLNPNGAELQMATNHYGHFLLTSLLIPSMKLSSGSRIVTVSSTMAHSARLDFDNLQSERKYRPHRGAYAQSKLANLVFARELSRRLTAANNGIASIAAHPGWAVTNLGNAAGLALRLVIKLSKSRFQSAEAAALPLLFAATSPDAVSGRYYGPDGPKQAKGNPTEVAVPEAARDEEIAERLWEQSNQMTGIDFDVSRLTGKH